jgi:hypothetical protein
MRLRIKLVQANVQTVLENIYELSQKPKTKPLAFIDAYDREIRYVVSVGPGQIYVGPDLNGYGLAIEIGKLIYEASPPGEGNYHTLKIKKCQAPQRKGLCGHFFLQLHRKEKNYCSNQCAWRSYSKFVRDEEKKDRAKRKREGK